MAKSARFRFETVHRVRKLEEKNLKRELGALLSRLEQLIGYRKQIESGQEHLSAQLANVGKKAVHAAWTTVVSDRITYLDHQKKESLLMEEDVQKRINEKRLEVEKALQARKSLDRLFEKHMARLREKIRKDEEKILNELNLRRPVGGLNQSFAEKEE